MSQMEGAVVGVSRAYLGPHVSTGQVVEQRLGVDEVGGVEALGEPVVDVGEHRAGFVAPVRIA
jgi:hypothetical protein